MPIANEDVEAVARAIFDQLCTGEHSAMAQIDFARQRRYKEAARAVLSADPIERMREEIDALKHDLERVMQRENHYLNEAERMREALKVAARTLELLNETLAERGEDQSESVAVVALHARAVLAKFQPGGSNAHSE